MSQVAKARRVLGRGKRAAQAVLREVGSEARTRAGASGPDVLPAERVDGAGPRVLFLHHSTGERIWQGGVREAFEQRTRGEGTIVEVAYPDAPYPWSNDPFDYWRLWVAHGERESYRAQPTLRSFAGEYDLVVWKNCFTSAAVQPHRGRAAASSRRRTPENYRLQFEALRETMRALAPTRFLVWTIPPLVEAVTTPEQVRLVEEFTEWQRTEWDVPGDEVFLWDFRAIAAEDGVLPARFASGERDSHPNSDLASLAAPLLVQRMIDVLEGRGDTTDRTGRSGVSAP